MARYPGLFVKMHRDVMKRFVTPVVKDQKVVQNAWLDEKDLSSLAGTCKAFRSLINDNPDVQRYLLLRIAATACALMHRSTRSLHIQRGLYEHHSADHVIAQSTALLSAMSCLQSKMLPALAALFAVCICLTTLGLCGMYVAIKWIPTTLFALTAVSGILLATLLRAAPQYNRHLPPDRRAVLEVAWNRLANGQNIFQVLVDVADQADLFLVVTKMLLWSLFATSFLLYLAMCDAFPMLSMLFVQLLSWTWHLRLGLITIWLLCYSEFLNREAEDRRDEWLAGFLTMSMQPIVVAAVYLHLMSNLVLHDTWMVTMGKGCWSIYFTYVMYFFLVTLCAAYRMPYAFAHIPLQPRLERRLRSYGVFAIASFCGLVLVWILVFARQHTAPVSSEPCKVSYAPRL